MTGLLVAHPEWLLVVAGGWLALAVALAFAVNRGRERLRLLLGPAARTALASPARPLRDAGPLLAAVAIGIGLLGPRFGEGEVELSTSGIDVVLLLDVSQSMDARDTPPSRIDAARRGAAEILKGLSSGDRAALAVFAGRGLLVTPLSHDREAQREMLAAIDTSLVKPGGSDLSAGVESALTAFDPGDNRPRAMFVLSDGEAMDPRGEIRHATGEVAATRADVRVFAAAIGTDAGGVVPDHGVPLRDRHGDVVTSRRRTASLESLASATGGALFVADAWGHFDIARALSLLRAPVAAMPGSFVAHRVTLPVVVPFALAAFVLLLADWLPLPRRAHNRARRTAAVLRPVDRAGAKAHRAFARGTAATQTLRVALLCGCLLLVGANEREGTAPIGTRAGAVRRAAEPPDGPDGRALLAAGLAHAERGAWAEAERAFLGAAIRAHASDVAAIALHNLGVAALERNDLEAASNAFFDSLAAGANSSDRERRARTQWNLEWALTRRPASPPPGAQAPPAAPPLPTPVQQSGPQSGSQPEPQHKPRPKPQLEPQPEPQLERQPERQPEPQPKPEPAAQPTPTRDADRAREEASERRDAEDARADATAATADRVAEDVEAARAQPSTRDLELPPLALRPDERERWLERIQDDPHKAMVAAAFESRERKPGPNRYPTW